MAKSKKKYASAVLKTAAAEVGYLEKRSNSQLDSKTANAGYNNFTKYGRDMHAIYPQVMDFPAPWCDCFVDWCFYTTFGVTTAKKLLAGDFQDYTVASAQLYKEHGAWYSSPKPGDQIFFKNNSRICHTGFVEKVSGGRVYTIEGNTSGASGVVANGGGVCRKSYPIGYGRIAGYGRPKYDPEPAKNGNPYTEPKKCVTSPENAKKTSIKSYIAKGEGVKWVQWELVQAGQKITIDGVCGAKTVAAIKAYQKKKKLTVDGVAGSKTRAAMKKN